MIQFFIFLVPTTEESIGTGNGGDIGFVRGTLNNPSLPLPTEKQHCEQASFPGIAGVSKIGDHPILANQPLKVADSSIFPGNSAAAIATEKKRDYTTYTQIPHEYYSWIRGPAILAAQSHGVQVKFPVSGNNIVISGSEEDVETVKLEIDEIFCTKRGKLKQLCDVICFGNRQ